MLLGVRENDRCPPPLRDVYRNRLLDRSGNRKAMRDTEVLNF